MCAFQSNQSLGPSLSIFTVGVAGDSGSGKTTFTNALVDIFGSKQVSTISLDDYHLYDRQERAKRGITPLSYEANDFDRLIRDINKLKEGKPIKKPVYIHATGTFSDPVPFYPPSFLILEGLHTFSLPELRQLLDYSIFVDPDTEIKYLWKSRRDLTSRNYKKEQVQDEIKRRESDYLIFVHPQRAFADSVIQIHPSQFLKDADHKPMYQVDLCLSHPEECIRDIELNIDIFSLLSASHLDFLLLCGTRIIDSRSLRTLTFDGEILHETVKKIEQNIEEQTGVHPINIFSECKIINAIDLVRLLLSWRIINRRNTIGMPQPVYIIND